MVHAAIAGGSLALVGCVDRAIVDPSLAATDSVGGGTVGGGTTGGTDPTVGPTSGSPTDPTTNPTTPTDPTDPTGRPIPVPMPGPPQLIDAQILQNNVVELFFSEPMADPSAVDPSKFRLSFAWSSRYYGYDDGYTFYANLSRYTGAEQCYEYCWCDYYYYDYCYDDYCYEYCYTVPGPSVDGISLALGASADRILMTLSSSITSSVCSAVRRREDQGRDAGLFVHYTNNGSPQITDTDSEGLDAIAEHWALPPQRDDAYQRGVFPALDPFIPIPCNF